MARPSPPDIPRLEPEKENDAPWQLQSELEPPLQPGVYRRLMAGGFELATATPANEGYRKVMLGEQQSRLVGQVATPKADLGNVETATAKIKERARRFGADLAATCKVDFNHVYENTKEKVLPYGVVLALAMDYDSLEAAPHQPAGEEVTRGYMELAWVAIKLAAWLREQGWPAVAHHPRGDRYGECDMLFLPHAIAAGMGQLGKHGSLLTPEYGPRLRLAMVTTTLPLAAGAAVDYGFDNFCAHCTRCADTCPGQAMSPQKGHRRGLERWLIDTEACLPYFGAYDGCGVCLKECVLNLPGVDLTLGLTRKITNRYGSSKWWQVTHPDHSRMVKEELARAGV